MAVQGFRKEYGYPRTVYVSIAGMSLLLWKFLKLNVTPKIFNIFFQFLEAYILSDMSSISETQARYFGSTWMRLLDPMSCLSMHPSLYLRLCHLHHPL